MNIKSAQYGVDLEGNNAEIKATIDGKMLIVPLNPDNRHYQAIQEWVAEGNKIEDAD